MELAKEEGIEKARKVRTDSTVVETNIHSPKDSSLLHDVVRVLCRIMKVNRNTKGVEFTDHTRRSKRRHLAIGQGRHRKAKKAELYRDLVKATKKTIKAARRSADALWKTKDPTKQAVANQLREIAKLGDRVVDQTVRRVFKDEIVPAQEKVVSIFEEHSDIIRRDKRSTEYGHKVNLTTGKSGLILDCVVEEGNPPDSTRAVTMIERQKEIYGRPPRQAAFDGGYTSRENLVALKKLGVKDVSFSKRRGLEIPEMVKSSWVYRQLKNFRAGIEARISYLKRCFGLSRCNWKGSEHFDSYVWGSVLAHNVLVFGRHRLS